VVAGVEVSPAVLPSRDTSYCTYMGSLTAPPRTESATWFVLKTAVDISAQEIGTFGKLYPRDVPPVQPLSGRLAQENQ
jgi:carbonic anhydrase